MEKKKDKLKLFGICIDNLNTKEILKKIEPLIEKQEPSLIVTPNIQHIHILKKDEEFREIYRSASLVILDSTPLLLISKIAGNPLKERIAGSDLLPLFASTAAARGFRLFFLGAGPGVAKKAAEILTKKNPGLRIVGTHAPSYGFENDERENKKIIELIKKNRPDVLFIGLGSPKQEKWAWRHKDKIKVPLIVCVGAAFDFIAEVQSRAPKWIQKSGLEWFYRLCREPLRLWKRNLTGYIILIRLAVKETIVNRLVKKTASTDDGSGA